MSASSQTKKKSKTKAKKQAKTAAKTIRPVDGPGEWDAWCAWLASRRKKTDLRKLIGSEKHPLRWCLPGSLDERTIDLIRLVDKSLAKGNSHKGKSSQGEPSAGNSATARLTTELEHWLGTSKGHAPTTSYAWQCLAWAHALPELASVLMSAPWNQLFEELVAVADQSAALQLDTDPLAHQLLVGELTLTLSWLFPELAECRRFQDRAEAAIRDGIAQVLDGDGLPRSRDLPRLRPLLACWTRCGFLAEALEMQLTDESTTVQFEWLIRQAMRLLRADGTQMLTPPDDSKWSYELFDALLDLAGDDDDEAVADLLLPGRRTTSKLDRCDDELPPTSDWSEWGGLAVMRENWSADASVLGVAMHGRETNIEWDCRSQPLLQGPWELAVHVDGRLLEPVSDWISLCWFSDHEVDYLELEIELASGWKVQRQLLAAHADRFLLLADAVIPEQEDPDPVELQYRSGLPLADGVGFEPAAETAEGVLTARRGEALVMPLAFPEWKTANRRGNLAARNGQLGLEWQGTARRTWQPLFVDFDRKRIKKPFTWRHLTVAEDLEIQPPDIAAGLRVQIGGEQFLIYRSMVPTWGRTVLGQNTAHEFICTRFSVDGEVDELVMIE